MMTHKPLPNHLMEELGLRPKRSTLFLSGFPHDVKHREVHNLFRYSDGYEDSILKPNGVAFALFVTQESALRAMEQLNGMYFDPDSPEMLRVELAKQNSKRRRDAEECSVPYFFSKERQERRLRKAAFAAASSYSPQFVHPIFGYTQAYGGGVFNPFESYAFPTPPPQAHQRPSKNQRVLTPCATIFVSNLSTDVQEEELRRFFGQLEGFMRLQLFQKKDNMSCFVQFKDIKCSTAAISVLEGYLLPSSSKGPLHAEFARNEMVLKPDAGTNAGPRGH